MTAATIRAQDQLRESEIAYFGCLEIVRECEIRHGMESNDELKYHISTNVTPVS